MAMRRFPRPEDEVSFLAGGGAPEEKPGEGMGEAFAADEVFDHENLPNSRHIVDEHAARPCW